METRAGILSAEWTGGIEKGVQRVKVDMGKPRLKMREIPAKVPGVDPEERVIGYEKRVGFDFLEDIISQEKGMSLVSMGNPHAVFITRKDLKLIDLEKVGPLIELDPMFPNRINVHFVKFNDAGD